MVAFSTICHCQMATAFGHVVNSFYYVANEHEIYNHWHCLQRNVPILNQFSMEPHSSNAIKDLYEAFNNLIVQVKFDINRRLQKKMRNMPLNEKRLV